MKKAAVLALLALLLLACALPGRAAMNRYSAMYLDTFDTVITLIGYAEDQETFDSWSTTVHETYQYLHKLFDNYNDYEGIVSVHTLNERAAEAPVQVDPILFSLLTFCKSQYALCQGQVNVAMGSVLSIWHTYREAGMDDPERAQLPPREELEQAQAKAEQAWDEIVG